MDLNKDTLLKLYETMITIRDFEEIGLYEMGQRRLSGSVHSSAGSSSTV